MRRFICLTLLTIFLLISDARAQLADERQLPPVHSRLAVDSIGLYIPVGNARYYEAIAAPRPTLSDMRGTIDGTPNGLVFRIGSEAFRGTVYYGLIPYGDTKYPQPVYFKTPVSIENGRAEVYISDLGDRYDMTGWRDLGKGVIGYRVIDPDGTPLYEGRIGFKGTGPFEVDDTMLEGPFISQLSDEGAVIHFETNNKLRCQVTINDKTFRGSAGTSHEIQIDGLAPATEYTYTVSYGKNSENYTLTTAPAPGSRQSFTFSYASDSRSGPGGGERSLGGTNAYIMKKIMALNRHKNAAFMQFSGDMVTGYVFRKGEILLEYSNWKKAIEPFAHHMPVITTMGNHEALMKLFQDPISKKVLYIDKFPFESTSAETAYQEAFVNPLNGPLSEDGSAYDPSSESIDFPSYKESVFHYTYDNVAMIVLNSDYWYAPLAGLVQHTDGNIHGYIMDNQLEWFRKTVNEMEQANHIDHIFITLHTPFFPNGGHVEDDMWYGGINDYRPVIAGKRVEKGIIERRDELLDIIVNGSSKVRAILTGDEHNYCRTELGPETNIYPDIYLPPRINLSRTIHQINNGAAGAPYYAQQKTPWTPWTSGFTTQNALVFFHVNGKSVEIEVINPDTLEPLDKLKLH